MDFVETVTINLPDLHEHLAGFDGHFAESHGLVVEVASIHEGATANYNLYPALELASSLPTWTSPYPKPALRHHDAYDDAVGRVIGSRMEKEDDGTPYIRLQIAITDVEAMQKVMDQRYLTGSVGGKAGKATCTICNADWSKASIFNMPCEHQRGKTYENKVAMIEMADITWKEYSFVNMPADERSGVRGVAPPGAGGTGESDFVSVRFFCFDLNEPKILELAGAGKRDVLAGFQESQAQSLYDGLKTAFLSALDVPDDSESQDAGEEEADPPAASEDEDVLAVSEALSEDLSTADGDSDDDGGEEAGESDGEEINPPTAEDEDSEDDGGEEEEGEEAEPSDEAADDDAEATSAESEEPDDKNDGPATGTPSVITVSSGNTGSSTGTILFTGSAEAAELLKRRIEELEGELSSLTTRNTELGEENTRLRVALKRGLAERVVDTKIALGICDAQEREQAIDAHLERSASSLADSLRDLASMPRQQPPWNFAPRVEPTGRGAESDSDRVVTTEDESDDDTSTTNTTATEEDVFVDILMGRRPA